MPRVRCVFSVGRRQVRLGNGGLPGPPEFATPDGLDEAAYGWRALTRVLRTFATISSIAAADVLHAVLPSDCRICEAPMLGLRPVRVCDACVKRVRAEAEGATDTLCTRCGDAMGMESARFAASMGVRECTACRLAPPAFTRAVAFGTYDDEMREMLHALKFGGMRRVAEHVFGEWMAEAVLQLQAEAAQELLVVPVPLFRERERQRGFNQAELLARAAVKRLRKARPEWKLELRHDALVRTRDTRPLYAQAPDQRRRGLKGAFRVPDPEIVRGREVLLIDDILTTGATARECGRVLLRAGATKVWVATVARAQAESVRAVEASVARWDAAPIAETTGAVQGYRG